MIGTNTLTYLTASYIETLNELDDLRDLLPQKVNRLVVLQKQIEIWKPKS